LQYTNKNTLQIKTSLSPGKKINRSKRIFDEAYTKESWEIHPTMIPFFTPMENRDVCIGGITTDGFSIMIAPVNHNKLNHNKTIQIVHTILGNIYQSENEVTIANQDFGNDASLVVGYHCKTLQTKTTNQMEMRTLHPEENIRKQIKYGFFNNSKDTFASELKSKNFKQILKTDATTTEGQNRIAAYFQVTDEWDKIKEDSDCVQAYYDLLRIVKRHSNNDEIYISFWEGLHRHAAIIMALLCSDITYETQSCYVPKTLTRNSFREFIKGYQAKDREPKDILTGIFDGTNKSAKMLKTVMNVMAYIPTGQDTDIDKIMTATRTQSQIVSENKLNSATRTLPTLLCDSLRICANQPVTNKDIIRPDIKHTYRLQKGLTETSFNKAKKTAEDNEEDYQLQLLEDIPACITHREWRNFLKNPAENVHLFTRECLSSKKKHDKEGIIVSPPYRIDFKSITKEVLPIEQGRQKLDVRHMNAYQIIPGIMYTLRARLQGGLVKTILNDPEVTKAIDYVTRYCYATRGQPFNTMHAACYYYNINWKAYTNNCEGNDEAIPVTVLLVSMYNACFTFQNDKRMNLLILTLQGLDDINRGQLSDRAFVRTFSEYKKYNIFNLHTSYYKISTNVDIYQNLINYQRLLVLVYQRCFIYSCTPLDKTSPFFCYQRPESKR
jgi:hypothetical protein